MYTNNPKYLLYGKGKCINSFFHIEEFFNNLDSIIIIRADGLYGYLWHAIDISKIKFISDIYFYKDSQLNFPVIVFLCMTLSHFHWKWSKTLKKTW